MMQRIEERAFTRDDAYQLTEKLIRKGTANYVIRDALIEQGLSAYMASEIIREVRKSHLNDAQLEDSQLTKNQIALIIIALMIVLMLFFVLTNPVS